MLTEEQIAEFKEAFDMHDEEGNGMIATKDLGAVMRSLGHHLDEAELQQIIDRIKQESDNMHEVSFQDFLLVQARTMEDKCSDEDIMVLNAFKAMRELILPNCEVGVRQQVFDKHNEGFLPTESVRHIFQKDVAGLDAKAVDELIKLADKNNSGLVDYKMLINAVSDGK